jgi:hypothetical protein
VWTATGINPGNSSENKCKEACVQKQRFVVLIILPPLLLLGCSPSFTRQIDKAQEKWDAQGITDYHIVIKFHENFANNIETQREVTVRSGTVTESSCISGRCPEFVLADVYTVDDLFLVARGSTLASMDMLDEYKDCVQSLEFDETYGFPGSMRIDCPLALDEEHSFQVVSFEVLK